MFTLDEETWLRMFCAILQSTDLQEVVETVAVKRAAFVADLGVIEFNTRHK